MPLEMLNIHCRLNVRMLVQLPGIRPERWMGDERLTIAFEMSVMHCVKADRRGEKGGCRLRSLPRRKRCRDRRFSSHSSVSKTRSTAASLGGLGSGKARFVYPIIEVCVDAGIDLVDLRPQLLRIVVASLGPEIVERDRARLRTSSLLLDRCRWKRSSCGILMAIASGFLPREPLRLHSDATSLR